ncbi:unnamed protein product [Cercospora beticola]|nr:unnamed protein product [Cercospora beticola]
MRRTLPYGPHMLSELSLSPSYAPHFDDLKARPGQYSGRHPPSCRKAKRKPMIKIVYFFHGLKYFITPHTSVSWSVLKALGLAKRAGRIIGAATREQRLSLNATLRFAVHS